MQPYLADLRINGRATSSKKCLGALLDDSAGLQDFPRQPGDWDLRDAIHCDPFAFRGGLQPFKRGDLFLMLLLAGFRICMVEAASLNRFEEGKQPDPASLE